MTKLSGWMILLLFSVASISSPAQTYSRLTSFNWTDGGNPMYGALIQGQDGDFYGTSSGGGSHNAGTIFKVGAEGKLTTLYNFCSQPNCADGSTPTAGLVLAENGSFFGTASLGGTYGGGTIFKITPHGQYTTLYSFCSQPACADGSQPLASLVQATNGDLYGTASEGNGGTSCIYGCGTVFRITQGGTFTTLYTFCSLPNCIDGGDPIGSLIQGTDGSFYGTTLGGGAGGGYGTVFKLSPGGKLTTLHSFSGPDGMHPAAALVEALDGNFYGTTFQGGAGVNDVGTVFKLSPSGTFATLYNFCSGCAGGTNPDAGLWQATDGNLYGTAYVGGAYYNGTIYEITPDGAFTTLYNFCTSSGCPDGGGPLGGVLQSTSGLFYGTTNWGGAKYYGTVFELNNGLGPFVAFVLPQGKVGQVARILGQGFTGTTNVSFNGVPATFTVVFGTFLEATVPSGATTGYVTVTTPSGTLTSNVQFHVLP